MKTQLLPVLVLLGTLALLSAACDGGRESYEPDADGEDQYVSAVPPGSQVVELALGDFCFYPDPLHLTAGETVTLKITNLGNLRHELMGGRELGGHGYERDFFAGLEDVQLSADPRGYTWGMESEGEEAPSGDGGEAAEPAGESGHGHGEAPPAEWSPEDEAWDCASQVMSRANGADYDMYAHHEDIMDEDDGASLGAEMGQRMEGEGAAPMEGEEAGHGGEAYELTLDAFATAYMTFTVPEDYVGEWDIGCFIPRHYERGMGGRIIVE